jgi:hypothetical protein
LFWLLFVDNRVYREKRGELDVPHANFLALWYPLAMMEESFAIVTHFFVNMA